MEGVNTINILLITIFFIAGYFHTLYLVRLMKRLETEHKEKLPSLNLPPRYGIFFLATPMKYTNLLKFIFGKVNFVDSQVENFKYVCKITLLIMLLSILGTAFF